METQAFSIDIGHSQVLKEVSPVEMQVRTASYVSTLQHSCNCRTRALAPGHPRKGGWYYSNSDC